MSERGLLPAHVLTEIDSPVRESRLSAVEDLSRLVHGADLDLAAEARLALRHLTDDDSRSVAAAAAAALERSTVRLHPERVDFGEVPPDTPRLVADVEVAGPPLAVGAATVTASGPGLRAVLDGRRLRIVWLPHAEWLDGSVTVRGPAGWAEVRVTGQVTAGPMSRASIEARLRAVQGAPTGEPHGPRITVLPSPAAPVGARPARGRHAGTTVLIAGLTTLVLLGGAGVAWALVSGRSGTAAPTAAASHPGAAGTSAPAAAEPVVPPPAGASAAVERVPLAQRVRSLAKPSVIGTVRVGREPEGVAVAPDGRTVYVANQATRQLSVVDTASRRGTSVTLRNTPRFVAVSRDGTLVYVSMYEADKSGSGVAVVDAATRTVGKYLGTGQQPFALAVGPDNRLWVPIHSHGVVQIFTAGDQRAAGEISVPANPHAIAFSGDQMRAYTANHESHAVTVIDMRADRTLGTVPVSRAPHSIAVSPDGRRVLVAGYEADAADLIDAMTLRRTGPFRVGSKPQAVAFSTDSAHGYVVNEGSGTVSVLDSATGKTTATVRVGRSPRAIAVSPDGRTAWVTNGGDNTVSILRVGA
jgi:YVTN family beta-propeller protein